LLCRHNEGERKPYMTSTFSRTLFGNTTYNRVSRFVKEIPEELLISAGIKRKQRMRTLAKERQKERYIKQGL